MYQYRMKKSQIGQLRFPVLTKNSGKTILIGTKPQGFCKAGIKRKVIKLRSLLVNLVGRLRFKLC